jgi:hypothetical protein
MRASDAVRDAPTLVVRPATRWSFYCRHRAASKRSRTQKGKPIELWRGGEILYANGFMLLQRLLAVTVLYGTIYAFALGQNPPHRLQEELIEADRRIWEAIAGSHPNIDQVSQALAPDYIDLDSGVRHSREEVLQYLAALTKFSFEYGHARAYLLSSTSGYVIAELSYSSVQNGNATMGKVLTTTVFTKEHGRWMAHLHTEMDMKPETR